MSDEDSSEQPVSRPHLSLQTTQSTKFGHGWVSGVFSVTLGIIGLGAVLCFHFPSWLTMPELLAAQSSRSSFQATSGTRSGMWTTSTGLNGI